MVLFPLLLPHPGKASAAKIAAKPEKTRVPVRPLLIALSTIFPPHNCYEL
jgi:hypothetical protein